MSIENDFGLLCGAYLVNLSVSVAVRYGLLHRNSKKCFLSLFIEQFGLMVGGESVDHGADVAVDEVVQVITGEIDPVESLPDTHAEITVADTEAD